MTPAVAALMDKARRALASADLLLEDGDADGACNRAYYAMHDAASAALLDAGVALPKTHSGLVSAFGLTIVAAGRVERHVGASLSRVQRVREIADYTGDGVILADAGEAVSAARAFVTKIEIIL